jgi:hypothetical protein
VSIAGNKQIAINIPIRFLLFYLHNLFYTNRILLLIFSFLFLPYKNFAQDSLNNKQILVHRTQNTDKQKDSVYINKHSPRKAVLFSAVIPGLGQAYNHKYWKIPIIYAGAGAIIYFVKFNNKNYKYWKNEYSYRTSTTYDKIKDKYPNYSDQNFIDLENYYRHNLELTYILGGLLYVLNILDAAVDANLYDYNINDDLSFRLEPICYPSYDKNINFAMKLTIKLK